MRTLLMTALFSVELLTAGQRMNVVVCNLGEVRESMHMSLNYEAPEKVAD